VSSAGINIFASVFMAFHDLGKGTLEISALSAFPHRTKDPANK